MSADAEQVQRDCPDCGRQLEGDAVICVKCGFDTRTGRKVGAGVSPLRHVIAEQMKKARAFAKRPTSVSHCPKCTASRPSDLVNCTRCGFASGAGRTASQKEGRSRRILVLVLCAIILLTLGPLAVQLLSGSDLFEPQDAGAALILIGLLVGLSALIPAFVGEIAFIGYAFKQSIVWGFSCILPQVVFLVYKLCTLGEAAEDLHLLALLPLVTGLAYWIVRFGFILSHWEDAKRLLLVWCLPVFVVNLGLVALYFAAVTGGWADKLIIFR